MSLARELRAALDRISDLERRLSNTVRHGVVEEVDTAGQRVRLVVGKGADGTPQLSPWIRYGQMAGALKVHAPPSKGQNMTMFAPGGTPEQAVAFPFSWNSANQSPGTDENPVLTFGDVKLSLEDGRVVVDAPNLRVRCNGAEYDFDDKRLKVSEKIEVAKGFKGTGGTVDFDTAYVRHQGVNIGNDHKHTDVQRGGEVTGKPEQ